MLPITTGQSSNRYVHDVAYHNWPDALKGLQLLEQYRARLEGTDELALQGTLSNAIAALRSSRFTALLGREQAHDQNLCVSGVGMMVHVYNRGSAEDVLL